MTESEQLIAKGAHSVAGDIFHRHTILGTTRDGVFSITPEGQAFLEVEDVVAKPRRSRKAAETVDTPDAVDDFPSPDDLPA